jgi:hypothetical protein
VTEADIANKNAVFDTPLGFVERMAEADNTVTI